MLFKQKIWSVGTTVATMLAEPMADLLSEEALAVTVLAPPRKPSAQIEALFDSPPDIAALTARLSVIALLKNAKPPKLVLKEMPKLDWLKKVAEDFPPLPIARWTIHGAQHRVKVPNRRLALQIDATSAFGTGEHPTTRGCLLMLDEMLEKGMLMPREGKKAIRMLDMGCGSGILALAFAKATHGHAIAIDLDPDSIAIARGNATVNGMRKNIRCAIGNGYRAALTKENAPYDLIMSNIFAGPLSHMAKDLKKSLRPGGMAILAGLLNHQANRVMASHRMQKLYLIKRMVIGEWTILALKRR